VPKLQRGFEEVDKPLQPREPREFGQVIGGRRYGGDVVGGRWLPLPSAAAQYSPWLRFDRLAQLELGAHVAIFSARVGFNPLELADFLLGFAGLDIALDDRLGRFAGYTAQATTDAAYTARARRTN
jgi:hypothetical protein